MKFVEKRQRSACGRTERNRSVRQDFPEALQEIGAIGHGPSPLHRDHRATLTSVGADWPVLGTEVLALTLEDLLAAPVVSNLDRAVRTPARARFETGLETLRRLRPPRAAVESVLHILRRRLVGRDSALVRQIDALAQSLAAR